MTTAPPRFKLIFYAPHTAVEACKSAIFAHTTAGHFPPTVHPSPSTQYTQCAFSVQGTGQFAPTDRSNPAIGTAGGGLEREPETRVEIMCPSAEVTREAVRKLKEAHPYEVPVYEVYRLEDF